MSSVFKATLHVTDLVVAVPVTMFHGLHDNFIGPVVPDEVVLANAAGYTIAADDKTVTITRGSGPADVDVVVESWSRAKSKDHPTLPAIMESGSAALITALQVKSKYQLALIDKVHMLADLDDINALIALPVLVVGVANQAAANARANALQASFVGHLSSDPGTAFVDNEHQTTDATNRDTLAAIPIASSSPTCITLINGLAAAIISHGDETVATKVHFHDDTTASGTGFTMTTDPPVTLANQVNDLNDIRQALLNHYSLGSF